MSAHIFSGSTELSFNWSSSLENMCVRTFPPPEVPKMQINSPFRIVNETPLYECYMRECTMTSLGERPRKPLTWVQEPLQVRGDRSCEHCSKQVHSRPHRLQKKPVRVTTQRWSVVTKGERELRGRGRGEGLNQSFQLDTNLNSLRGEI